MEGWLVISLLIIYAYIYYSLGMIGTSWRASYPFSWSRYGEVCHYVGLLLWLMYVCVEVRVFVCSVCPRLLCCGECAQCAHTNACKICSSLVWLASLVVVSLWWCLLISFLFLPAWFLKVLSEYPETKLRSEQQIISFGETFPELVKRLDEGIASGLVLYIVEWYGVSDY